MSRAGRQGPPSERQRARWLALDGSLTERLTRLCGHRLVIEVMAMRVLAVCAEDRRLLGLSVRQRCLERRVLIRCGAGPWVYARTLIPLTSMVGPVRQIKLLGDRPLGTLLFSHAGVRQDPVRVLQLDGVACDAAGDFPQALREQRVWARQTRYFWNAYPLLVSEFFYPVFWEAANLKSQLS
jgi:chorismate--pyruvate lyase